MNQPATTTERTTETASRMPTWDVPPANIREEHDVYIIELEMPGVNKGGLNVSVENNELTIMGHRSDTESKAEVVYRESRRNDYRRSFELDPSIDTAKIAARMDQGLLTLTLPKAESIKPRKITVGD